MTIAAPTFEEFAAPLLGAAPGATDAPLAELAAGDFAVLAWLDDVRRRYAAAAARAEAAVTESWDTATVRDVYALLFPSAGNDDGHGAPAAAAGGPRTELDAVRRLFESEIDRGIETGVQLSIAHRGARTDVVFGNNGAGCPMAVDTRVPWTCSSKPVGALAFAAAWDAGALDLDTPVHQVLPEFAGGGKDRITVRHLLTHTTGMGDPLMAVQSDGTGSAPWDDLEQLIWAVICASTTDAEPGTAMIYNPVSNWFVLDRVLTAVTGDRSGDSYRRVLGRLAPSSTLGPGGSVPPDQRVEVTSSPDQKAGLEAMRVACELPLPGTSVWGPMRDLRTVGEVLLAKGRHGDELIASPATIEAITATHWPGTPGRSICDTDFPYGLGVMTQPPILGRRCSFRVFGHAGGNTSTLVVDPTHQLVVAVYWNGRLNDVKTIARRYALVRALHADLGIA